MYKKTFLYPTDPPVPRLAPTPSEPRERYPNCARERTFSLQERYMFHVSLRRPRLVATSSTSSNPPASAAGHSLPGHKKSAEADDFLCPGEDLNLHVLRHTHLKRTRLPISPPGQNGFYSYVITNITQKYYFFLPNHLPYLFANLSRFSFPPSSGILVSVF